MIICYIHICLRTTRFLFHNVAQEVLLNSMYLLWKTVINMLSLRNDQKHSLIEFISNFLQLITNDKFISVNHRVLAKRVGPRVSVACFFRTHRPPETSSRLYGPMKELLSQENPPLYRETTIKEYMEHYYAIGLCGISALEHFKL